MITFLQGLLAGKEPTRAVIDVNGVGYEVTIPLSSYERLPAVDAPCRLLTHFHVREDAQELYGFATAAERELFRLLLAVSGIGPKTAMNALSGMSVREMKAAIVTSDVKRLTRIPGIGKKTAERIVLELKDKIDPGEALEAASGGAAAAPADLKQRDAILALVSLGFKQADAQKRVLDAAAQAGRDVPVEELIRRSLGR